MSYRERNIRQDRSLNNNNHQHHKTPSRDGSSHRHHPYYSNKNSQQHNYPQYKHEPRPKPDVTVSKDGWDGSAHRRHPYYSNTNSQQRNYLQYKPEPPPKPDVVAVSKYLSFILRHPTKDSRLQMNEEGYIYIKDILKESRFRNRLGLSDIFYVVENNDKRRFAIKQDSNGDYMIRATQGHSVEVNLHLEPILHPDQFPIVVHGTTYEAWQFIRTEGLKKMNRAYIHFAIGMPGASGVVSGMRNSSEICIFINLRKAMYGGIKFFLSENMVILSQGDGEGRIHPTFFEFVIDRKTHQRVY